MVGHQLGAYRETRHAYGQKCIGGYRIRDWIALALHPIPQCAIWLAASSVVELLRCAFLDRTQRRLYRGSRLCVTKYRHVFCLSINSDRSRDSGVGDSRKTVTSNATDACSIQLAGIAQDMEIRSGNGHHHAIVDLAHAGGQTCSVAGALGLVIAPISNAVYPRVTEFVVRGESDSLARAYHNFAQMLTLMVVPASIVLSLFARHVLLLWTRDLRTTDQTASLVSVLVIGVMLNGLMHTPYTLQLAHGWTRFMVVVNTIAVVIVIPSIYIGVRAYGPICAAYIWTLLNAAYILVAVPMMHRRLLPAEMWRWYGQDVIVPGLAAFCAAALARLLAPLPMLGAPFVSALVLGLAAAASLSAAVLATPLGREGLRRYVWPLLTITRIRK